MTWATSVPILVFLGLTVLELGPMYATDRQTDVGQTDVRQKQHLMPPPYVGGGIMSIFMYSVHAIVLLRAYTMTLKTECVSL